MIILLQILIEFICVVSYSLYKKNLYKKKCAVTIKRSITAYVSEDTNGHWTSQSAITVTLVLLV